MVELEELIKERDINGIIARAPFSVSHGLLVGLSALTIREIWTQQITEWYPSSIELMEYIHSRYPDVEKSLYERILANMKLKVLLLLYISQKDNKQLILDKVMEYFNGNIYKDSSSIKAKYNFMMLLNEGDISFNEYLFGETASKFNKKLTNKLDKYLNEIKKVIPL